MPTGVTASNKTATSLNISWTMKNLNWQPTTFEVQYCFIKSVSKASVPISGPVCHGQENLNGSLETFLSDLKPFSEYKITVIGSHDMFEKQSEASIQIRTRKLKIYLIHSADPQSWSVGINTFTRVVRPS